MSFDPSVDYALLLAVPLIPLVGYVVQIFFGKSLPRQGDWLMTGGMFVVMCITVYLFAKSVFGGFALEGFFHESVREGGPAYGWFYRYAEKLPGLNVVAGMAQAPGARHVMEVTAAYRTRKQVKHDSLTGTQNLIRFTTTMRNTAVSPLREDHALRVLEVVFQQNQPHLTLHRADGHPHSLRRRNRCCRTPQRVR